MQSWDCPHVLCNLRMRNTISWLSKFSDCVEHTYPCLSCANYNISSLLKCAVVEQWKPTVKETQMTIPRRGSQKDAMWQYKNLTVTVWENTRTIAVVTWFLVLWGRKKECLVSTGWACVLNSWTTVPYSGKFYARSKFSRFSWPMTKTRK